ncbi:MAG: arsenate reductase ArsC [Coriobacteriia bacterium]|nr:arsenate reductase ArsC [Coriobacteriia bacterium]
MAKPRIAFVCTHNARRSQMAEAIANHLGGDIATFLSAGTEIAERVDPLAREAVFNLFGIVMDDDYRPKLIEETLPVDLIVTMGCDVACPATVSKGREDWKLTDPTGGSIQVFEASAKDIYEHVLGLVDQVKQR